MSPDKSKIRNLRRFSQSEKKLKQKTGTVQPQPYFDIQNNTTIEGDNNNLQNVNKIMYRSAT